MTAARDRMMDATQDRALSALAAPPPSSAFWDKTAERYARAPISDEASYQKKLATTRSYLNADMELLEIGCGTGSTALVHAPHVRHILATDLSPKMIEIARSKAARAGIANVTFEAAAVEALDFPTHRFDAVLALSVLHLLDDWDTVVSRAAEWLKPGGVLVTSTACLADDMRFLKPVLPVMRAFGRAPAVVRFFAADALVQAMVDAGLVIEHRWKPGPRKAVFIVARKPD